MSDFVIAAVSGMGAAVISNPLEVIKTRYQLQGELRAKGQYAVHYRNIFHAMYIIVKTDGILSLQKGLVPALCHQVSMNGFRLGFFSLAERMQWTKDSTGDISYLKTAVLAALLGGVTAYTGSPFFLVKVQLQAQSSESIAVGTQHKLDGMVSAMTKIYQTHGVKGLWRGVGGSVPRRLVGSSTQITSFTYFKEVLANNEVYPIPKGNLNSLGGSLCAGVVVTVAMNPLDTISTRLYNQGVDAQGRGLLYSSYFDCVRKMFKTEGLTAFYKGIVPLYIRTGPQTTLLFMFWDAIRAFHDQHSTT